MAQHSWRKLDSFVIIFGCVFTVGIFLPFLIAFINGTVTVYVPYISEGGAHFPQAGIFSACIAISAFLSQWIMILRFLIVEERSSKADNGFNVFLNNISLVLGSLSTIAFIIVGSFPTTSLSGVHNAAAGTACICIVIYMICHTWISFRMPGISTVSKFRLAIVIFSSSALVLVVVFGVLGSAHWNAAHWPGSKTPRDQGFASYVISSSAEWILAILFLLFFATYIPEFKRSTFHFKLEVNPQQENLPTVAVIGI